MTFPLYIILIIYIIIIIIYLTFSAIILYHIFRFGYWDSSTRLMMFLFFLGTILILIATIIYSFGVDWSETITIFPNFEFNFSIE